MLKDRRTATFRDVAGDLRERTLTVSLLARLIYAVEIGNHQRMAANWNEKKAGKLPDPPDPVELPGDEPKTASRSADITGDDMRAWRERHRRGRSPKHGH